MTNTNTVEAASFVPQLRLLLLLIVLFKTHCLLTIHYHKPCDQQKYFRICFKYTNQGKRSGMSGSPPGVSQIVVLGVG